MSEQTPVTQSLAHTGLAPSHPVVDGDKQSRTLVNNPAMRVVQFTFDAGAGLSEHDAPGAVAVVLNSGELDFTVDGTVHRMTGGDVLYLAPGVPHAVTAVEASRMTLVITDIG